MERMSNAVGRSHDRNVHEPEPEPPGALFDGEGRVVDEASIEWQLQFFASWTNEDFALGLFAGIHTTPGGCQHELPTWEVLDVARACTTFSGFRALRSYALMLGVVAGVLLDRAAGLFRWYVRFTLGPMRFLQGFFLAWCYGLSKYATARSYCTWTAVGALIMTPAAPLSLRLLALAYECRLAGPYYAGAAEVSFFFTTSFSGVVAAAYIAWASFPWLQMAAFRFVQARVTDDVFERLAALPLRFGRVLLPLMLLLTFVPGNAALVCTAGVVLPSYVVAKVHPWLGFLAHVLLRANAHGEVSALYNNFTSAELFHRAEWIWPARSLLQKIYGARFYGTVAGENCWEDKDYRNARHASDIKYRAANIIERRKAKRRERRLALEAVLCEMPRLPTDVHDTVLEFAGAPRGRDAPDERSYPLFRRRPKRVEPSPVEDLLFNEPRMAMTAVAGAAFVHGVLPTSLRQRISRQLA